MLNEQIASLSQLTLIYHRSVGFAHEKLGLWFDSETDWQISRAKPTLHFLEVSRRAADHRTKQACSEKSSALNESIASPSQTLLPIKKVV